MWRFLSSLLLLLSLEANAGFLEYCKRALEFFRPGINTEELQETLVSKGFSEGFSRKVAQSRPDIAKRIAADPEVKPVKAYRGLTSSFAEFDPKFKIGKGSKNNRNGFGDPNSPWLADKTEMVLTYTLQGPIAAGTIVEYELPSFMYVKESASETQGQIPIKLLRSDQTPFISRIAVMNGQQIDSIGILTKEKTVDDYIQEWRPYP
jgi:hypothetical protein